MSLTQNFKPFIMRLKPCVCLLVALIPLSFIVNAQNNPSSSAVVRSQNELVRGTVTDSGGETLAGVLVKVQGKNAATSTNVDGVFSIAAAVGDVLEIRLLGFQTRTVKVLSIATPLSIKLEIATNKLDEIVVIGYGETTRRTLTSAQTTISSVDIERTVNTTFDQALQGRAAGVQVTTNSAQPGGGISVNIRGLGSLGGSTEPLYVIDGIQIQPELPGYGSTSSTNPLASLNPSDIESMEVLQGPSATAIYGSRATNGVVLISTKRGKAGETRVSYDVSYTHQGKPKEIGLLNLREFVTIDNEIRRILNQPIAVNRQDPDLLGEGTNWQDAIFKTAPLVKHQVSVRGGNDKTKFYLSGERFKQDGVVLGSGFDRTGVRFNLDNDTRKWLKLSANFSANQTNDDLGTTVTDGIKFAFIMPPYISPRNPDGSYGGYPAEESTYRQEDLNPYAMAQLKTHTQKRNVVNGGVTATATIISGLQLRTGLNGSFNNTNVTNFNPTWKIGSVSNEQASLGKTYSESFYWNWNQLLEYKKRIAGVHDISLMVSHESQASRYEGASVTRVGFSMNEMPGGELPSINLGDEIGQRTGGWRGWWAQESYLGRAVYNYKDRYIANFTYRGDGSVNFGAENRWGFFPSFSAAWRISDESFFKNRIKFIDDLKLRYETGLTGNQGSGGIFAPLRPVSSPWGNGFMITSYANPGLKWEETATHNFGLNVAFLDNRINLEADIYVRKTDNLIMRNPLPWYMGTGSKDAANIQAPYVNIGTLENRGWSLTLNTVNIKKDNLKWNTNFNISHNKTTVLKFYQETATVDMSSWKASDFIQRSAVGELAWQFYGYEYAGMFQSIDEVNASAVPWFGIGNPVRRPTNYENIWVGDYKFVDRDGDGLITPEDKTYIGNPYPTFTFGFTNDVTYKNFNLSVLITGSVGNKIYNAFRYGYVNPARVYSYVNSLKEALNYARIGFDDLGDPYILNPDATVPRYGGSNDNFKRANDNFVEDGSYMRIKNLTLSYNVPKKLISRTKVLQGLRVSVGVQNLYTLTNYSGFDPEVGVDIGNGSDQISRRTFGVDVGQYPQVRSFIFSAGVNF